MSLVQHLSKTVEWYTPPHVIELARQTMGCIALDPASCPKAQETVDAMQYFSAQQNGLFKAWWGQVWLNPPYGRATTRKWVDKAIAEYTTGRVIELIILVRPAISAKWFNKLACRFTRCETFDRIHFIDVNGNVQPDAAHGNILFFMGDDDYHFCNNFKQLGIISRPAFPLPLPTPKTINLS